MAARQRVWAAKAREKLFDILGRKCAWCEANEDECKLTFDCIVPTFDGERGHHKIEWSHRMSFYRRELDLDNLQVLCDSCNSKKGTDVIRFIPVRKPEMNWEHCGGMQPF